MSIKRYVVSQLLALLFASNAWAAFASVGTFISQGHKTNSTSWDTTTEAAISSGDLLVVIVAVDNIGTTDTETSEHTSLTVDGQALTKIAEYSNTTGAAGDGATTSLWVKQNSAAVSSGATVTLNISGLRVAKGMTGWRYTMNNSNTLTTQTYSTAKTTTAADPPSIALSSLPSREYLIVRAVAGEGGIALATTTPSSGYTIFDETGAGSSGGGGNTNMQARGEFIISTTTSSTSAPDYSFNTDNANIMAAFYEDGGGGGSDILDPMGMSGFFGQ